MSIKLFNDDCLQVMRDIESGSIDAIITDPPYYSTNLHFDKASRLDFANWLNECKRVLKPNGVLVSFADLNLLIELRSHKTFKSFYELIWSKSRAMGFLDANRRPLRSHEYICVFVNGLRSGSIYNPQKTKGVPYKNKYKARKATHYSELKLTGARINTGDRHPVSVLHFANSNHKSLHPTQKPIELCEWLVKTYSNEGDTILEPFMGSGSTGLACVNLNRKFIGCELNKGYFDIASKRIEAAQNELINQFGAIA